jgi:hypothetical protein
MSDIWDWDRTEEMRGWVKNGSRRVGREDVVVYLAFGMVGQHE